MFESEIYMKNKISYYKTDEINKMFENKYNFGSVSNKYPLLFEITANKKPQNINTDELIMNSYRYYRIIYDINNKNINELLKNYDFKKDTQIIHIAIHHNIEHKLKELDDYTQTNTIYKELLESRIYDLHKLSDYADVIVEEVNKYSSYEKNSDNIYLLLKEVQCLLYKYN